MFQNYIQILQLQTSPDQFLKFLIKLNTVLLLLIFNLGRRLCGIETALQNGHFCSFAEKGWCPDPQNPPVAARLEFIRIWKSFKIMSKSGKVEIKSPQISRR